MEINQWSRQRLQAASQQQDPSANAAILLAIGRSCRMCVGRPAEWRDEPYREHDVP